MNRPTAAGDISEAQQLFLERKYDPAERIARGLLQRNKRDANAMLLLGMIGIERRRPREAIAQLDRALKLAPDEPNLLTQKATARLMQGDVDEALGCYDHALRSNPAFVPAIWGKANLLEKRGSGDSARAFLDPHVREGRGDAEIVTLMANLLSKSGHCDEAVRIATIQAEDASLATWVRRDLIFAIGQAHFRAGDAAAAFERFQEGNRVLGITFNRAAQRASVDALIDTYTPRALGSFPRSTIGSDVPVFVVGLPRCGSTLIERVLDAHPKARGAGELPTLPGLVATIPDLLESDAHYPHCMSDFTEAAANRVAKSYLDELKPHGRHAQRLVDKMLNNYANCGLISLLFPQARIIHCRRNLMDIGLSCYLNLAPKVQPWAADLEDIGHVALQYERLMAHWRQVLEYPLLEVDYEKLAGNPEPEIRRIVEFCGLEWDDKCLSFHESTRQIMTHSYDQANRPVYDSSIGRHREYEQFLQPLKQVLDG